MNQVVSIKPVVAQLVHHYLISRKIQTHIRTLPTQAVHGKQQHRLAQLVGMQSIALMSYRAHRKHHLHVRVGGMQFVEQRQPFVHNIFHRQPATHKLTLPHLMAIGNKTPVSAKTVHIRRTQSDNQQPARQQAPVSVRYGSINVVQQFVHTTSRKPGMMHPTVPHTVLLKHLTIRSLIFAAAKNFPHRLAHRHRIVESAKRIDATVEMRLPELVANIVGKTRTHEHHPVLMRQFQQFTTNVHFRLQFHRRKFNHFSQIRHPIDRICNKRQPLTLDLLNADDADKTDIRGLFYWNAN